MYPAIQAGQVDALLQDLPVNIEHTKDGDFEIVEEYSTDESYGFAVKQDNTELLDAVNEQLKELRDNGTYDEIYNQYFATE
jgi:polar amino acid transport system substrate-binding protein